MKSGMFWTLFLFSVIGVHAQTLSFYQNEIRSDQVENLSGQREFRIGQAGASRSMRTRRSGFNLMATSGGSMPSNFGLIPLASGPNLPVLGSGTIGRLAKWTGLTSGNSFIGDSTIFESKFSLVGIGTDLPTSKLTVQGMIETTLGGIKFPDGTVQTTSAAGALFSVAHNSTLTGDGTPNSPLGVAIPLTLIGSFGLEAIITGSSTSGGFGVRGISTNGVAVRGETTSGAAGVQGVSGGTGAGVMGSSARGIGVQGLGGTSINGVGIDGIVGQAGPSTADGTQGSVGVRGIGGTAPGMGGLGGFGLAGRGGEGETPGTGVVGEGAGSSNNSSHGGDGVEGFGGASMTTGGTGLIGGGGEAFGNGGVGGDGLVAGRGSGPTDGLAGRFIGKVMIDGDLDVTGTKNFKIDHPLDPENKYLVHAALESSEALNVYSGNVTTDLKGEATVNLPPWFDALNRDLRYQLTVIGTFAQAIIASEVQNNRFVIKTNATEVKVSWQVTGVRCDAGMKSNPFIAERVKPRHEQGKYLNPKAYGQSEERSIHWMRYPELMQKIRHTEQRAKTKQYTR